MQRRISLLLLCAMLLSAVMLVGCPSPDGYGTTITTKPGDGSEQPSEWADSLDTAAIKKEIGKDATLVISCLDEFMYEVYAEEDSKSSLDQLIYKRNKKVEERFGVTIIPDVTVSQAEVDLYSHYTYAQTELRSMAPSFDLLSMMMVQSSRLISQKHCRDLRADVPYVRESLAANDPWWNEEMNTGATVLGRQYVGFSDYCISVIDSAFACLFNETLVNSYNIAKNYGEAHDAEYETMYDLVYAGEWTIDAMIEVTKDVFYETEGIGTPGRLDENDLIGYYTIGNAELDNYAFAFGFRYIENDGVGEPTLWNYPSTFDGIIAKMRAYLRDSVGAKINPFSYNYEESRVAFSEGHMLFITGWIDDFKRQCIRGMEDGAGILPYPKLNADQVLYSCNPEDTTDGLSVPKYTVGKRLKTVGAMVVALSAETYKSITKTYYEMIVKHDSGFVNKAAVDMIDKIMEGVIFDLSLMHTHDFVFSSDTGAKLSAYLCYLVKHAPQTSPSGLWGEAKPVLEGQLRALINAYRGIS